MWPQCDLNVRIDFLALNPPRPLASRRVDAPTKFQSLQTSQNLQTNLLGEGLPSPYRFQTLRAGELSVFLESSCTPWTLQEYVSKVTPQWSQSHPYLQNRPKVTSKCSQNPPKVDPKSTTTASDFRLPFPAVFFFSFETLFCWLSRRPTLDLTTIKNTFAGFAIFPKVGKSIKTKLQKSTKMNP